MQGRDQLPSWTSKTDESNDWVIVENHHQADGEVHLRTLVTPRYKMTVYRGREWGELFDLQEDRGELHNRFADPAYASIRGQMMEQLVQADLAREPAAAVRIAGA